MQFDESEMNTSYLSHTQEIPSLKFQKTGGFSYNKGVVLEI